MLDLQSEIGEHLVLGVDQILSMLSWQPGCKNTIPKAERLSVLLLLILNAVLPCPAQEGGAANSVYGQSEGSAAAPAGDPFGGQNPGAASDSGSERDAAAAAEAGTGSDAYAGRGALAGPDAYSGPDAYAGQEAPAGQVSQSRSYSAPAGGYAAPFGYNNGQAPLRSDLPGWPSMQRTGIVTARMTAPVLPQGLVLPVELETTIDINKIAEGDYVQARLSQNVSSGGIGYLPGSSVFSGVIVKAAEEKQFGRAGKYSINFQQVRLPAGRLLPVKAHLLGRIGTYIARDPDGAGGKFLSNVWRDGMGANLQYGAGTAFGSYLSHGYGPGSGVFAGSAMGGLSEVLTGVFCHPHHDLMLRAGIKMQLQLDEALLLPAAQDTGRYLPGTGRNTGMF